MWSDFISGRSRAPLEVDELPVYSGPTLVFPERGDTRSSGEEFMYLRAGYWFRLARMLGAVRSLNSSFLFITARPGFRGK